MSMVISVLTTKDGQGSSTFALSLAWSAAEEQRVLLVDADMAGTGNLADLVALDFGARGIGNLFGTLAISAPALEEQAVAVRQRPRLRLVAGLQGFCGQFQAVAQVLEVSFGEGFKRIRYIHR